MEFAGDGLLLGIDLGTSRTKVVLVDDAGTEAASAAVATPFATHDGRVQMDVDALRACLGDALAGLGDARERVAAVGVAGVAESGAPLDSASRAQAPVIAWHDGRGQASVEELERRFGDELPLRIGQRVRTVLTVSKVGWLLDHGMTGMVRWLGVPELVLHALTGAEATEFSLAARTGCYDVAARHWIPEVADALGFSVDVFPPVVAAGRVMGRISAQGAAWSGLGAGLPVTIAGHDHLAGMAGAGIGRDDAANSVGTAETLVARTATVPDMATALAEGVRITVYPGGKEWAALFGAARAGLVVEEAAAALGRSPQALDALAADSVPVDVADLVDDLAHGRPVTLPGTPPGAIWAGLLDALTARTVDGYARLTAVVGPRRRLVVFGGGSASEPWMRAKVAALPLPVVRSPVASAVARGAALYAGVAAGWWPSVDAAPN